MEQVTQLRTLTQTIPECVMVEDLMRLFPENISLLFKSEKPRGQEALDFLEQQSILHTPKRQRTEFASWNGTWEAPYRTGPTPQAPPQMISSVAIGETEEAFSPFSVPPPGHQSGNDGRA
jgi:hypothetical protein